MRFCAFCMHGILIQIIAALDDLGSESHKISAQKFNDRFGCEARAVAALNHPHISALYDIGPDYPVMEYVEDEPLKGPLPLAKVLEHAKKTPQLSRSLG